MKPSLFLRLFPPPQYLAWRPTAIDLSDRSLKFCRLSFVDQVPKLETYGEKEIPAGAILGGWIKNLELVANALREAAHSFEGKYVIASLPEEPGFTFLVSLPAASRGDLRGAIELQLEEHIPLPPAGVIFDYEILREPTGAEEQFQVVVSAFPKDVIADYVKVFSLAGLDLVALEAETRSITRALCCRPEVGAALIVDLGKTHTSLIVATNRLSVLTRTVADLGGDFFTKMIGKNLGLGEVEAEQAKNQRGLLSSTDNSVRDALLPAASVLGDEIGRFLLYWNTQTESEWRGLPKIEKIILSGGQALLPGLSEYLSSSLKVKTEVGVPSVPVEEAARKTVVLGLAMRFLDAT